MGHGIGRFVAVLGLIAAPVAAQPAPQPSTEFESVYATPDTAGEAPGVNEGGVHFDFIARYLSDYVYRGIDRSEIAGQEDAPNGQIDFSLEFDFGKAPHPYLGLFANVYDADPLSRFQEIRPYFGFEWEVRPLVIGVGHNAYLFPEREEQQTAEAFIRIAIDDSYMWKREEPLLSPYVYGAYDYDLYSGWYFEFGINHETEFDDIGLTLRAFADAAYVTGYQLYDVNADDEDDTGFQHYDVGMVLSYNLNDAFGVPPRFGNWIIEGYLTYTDGIGRNLRADTQLWGGVGLHFRY